MLPYIYAAIIVNTLQMYMSGYTDLTVAELHK